MKTNRIFTIALAAIVAVVMLSGCGGSKQVAANQPKPGYSEDEFEKFIEPPCTMYDDSVSFTGSGSAYGSVAQEAVVRRAALVNAQNIVRQKMKHAYQGMVSDYFNLIGSNTGSTARSNIEEAGDQIIDVVVNETMEKCIRRSKTADEKGNITYYIGIVINKKAAADKITDALDEKFKNHI